MRRITLTIKGETPKELPCIYKIWFGRRFYLGLTKNLKTRLYHHERCLNIELAKCNFSTGMYQLVVGHLLNHQDISEGIVEVIEYCTERELMDVEQKHLLRFKTSKKCLNVFRIHYRTRLLIQQEKKNRNVL